MIYIVGSGPAGVACAWALVRQGLEVTMLDAGIEMEKDRQEKVDALGQRPSNTWEPGATDFIKENMAPNTRGVPLKYVFGSDFPFQEIDQHTPLVHHGTDVTPSLAQGGLSNAWAAAIAPYTDSDIADWPIRIQDLAPHYASLFGFVGLSAIKDDLENVLPLYTTPSHMLRPSRQAVDLLTDMERHRTSLYKAGITFGHARLAMRGDGIASSSDCEYCGLCLYGCPYNLLYNSAFTLKTLQHHPNFHYRKDVIVRSVNEAHGQVRISAYARLTKKELSFDAERVYLACGVLATTQILLTSLDAYDQPVTLQDSTYVLFPSLRYKRTSGVMEERLHTMAQVYIDIQDDAFGPYLVHLQTHTYSDMYRPVIQQVFGALDKRFKGFSAGVLDRLYTTQAYFHSRLVPPMKAHLERPRSGQRVGSLHLEAAPDYSAIDALVRKLMLTMIKHQSSFKSLPIWPLASLAKPARSYHIGGTFPMRSSPQKFESDILGRPTGFEKVHVVDASVFPSIPATTITFNAMANAHRIASLYHEV